MAQTYKTEEAYHNWILDEIKDDKDSNLFILGVDEDTFGEVLKNMESRLRNLHEQMQRLEAIIQTDLNKTSPMVFGRRKSRKSKSHKSKSRKNKSRKNKSRKSKSRKIM